MKAGYRAQKRHVRQARRTRALRVQRAAYKQRRLATQKMLARMLFEGPASAEDALRSLKQSSAEAPKPACPSAGSGWGNVVSPLARCCLFESCPVLPTSTRTNVAIAHQPDLWAVRRSHHRAHMVKGHLEITVLCKDDACGPPDFVNSLAVAHAIVDRACEPQCGARASTDRRA